MKQLIRTDDDGVRDLREMLNEHRNRTGGMLDAGALPALLARVFEIIEVPEEGDDYSEVSARLVKRDRATPTDIEQVRTIDKVRFLGGRPVLIRAAGQLIPLSTHQHLNVQLTEELDAAVSAYDEPSTATANVLVRTPGSPATWAKMTHGGSDVTVTVTNHNEHWDALAANTCGTVMLINDEWQPGAFDCDARAEGLIS